MFNSEQTMEIICKVRGQGLDTLRCIPVSGMTEYTGYFCLSKRVAEIELLSRLLSDAASLPIRLS